MAKTINSQDLDIAPYIDHTLLNQTATPEEIQQFCYQAERYKFASVCVFPHYVKLAKELLQGKTPKVSTVIGFPTGATTSKVKLYEAQEAVENGATELDVVINLSWLKTGKSEELYQEIAEICDETGQTVKAIIETTILTEEEKRLAVEVLMDTGIAYIKTSTGWYGGATVADIQLIKSIAKGRVGIKASGGIRTYQQAVDLIIAGATRLGTSRGVEILTTEIQGEDSY